jgi:cytochrome c biogenesis protein CcmG/thiol:disulfide interchange protein DsbE
MSVKAFKISIEAALWIAVLGFVGYRMWPQAASALGLDSGGVDAPDFRVETLDGRTVALSDLRGQVVLVNFWATWCPPCRFEMPGFQRVYEEYRDQGFTILGLSMDRGGTHVVREFLDERGITYPVAMATPEAVRAFGGANLLPTSYLIDKEGRIRYTVKGVYTETALSQAVGRLLRETPDAAPAGRLTAGDPPGSAAEASGTNAAPAPKEVAR